MSRLIYFFKELLNIILFLFKIILIVYLVLFCMENSHEIKMKLPILEKTLELKLFVALFIPVLLCIVFTGIIIFLKTIRVGFKKWGRR